MTTKTEIPPVAVPAPRPPADDQIGPDFPTGPRPIADDAAVLADMLAEDIEATPAPRWPLGTIVEADGALYAPLLVQPLGQPERPAYVALDTILPWLPAETWEETHPHARPYSPIAQHVAAALLDTVQGLAADLTAGLLDEGSVILTAAPTDGRPVAGVGFWTPRERDDAERAAAHREYAQWSARRASLQAATSTAAQAGGAPPTE